MAYTPAGSFTTRPTLQGTFGMTASTHWLATASAQAVLERGGNAFDAAVAGAFVLHVVEPHLNGPGGDMTGVFTTAGNPSEPVVLMGQGPAPAAATREHYLAEGLELVPGAGALAAARVCVPALLRRPAPRQGRFLVVASAAASRGLPMRSRSPSSPCTTATRFRLACTSRTTS